MTELINKYKASIKDLEGQYQRTRDYLEKESINQMIDDQREFVADMERVEKYKKEEMEQCWIAAGEYYLHHKSSFEEYFKTKINIEL